MLVGSASRLLERFQKRGLQPAVDLLNDLRDEGFFRAEIMEEHAGAGSDRGGQGAQGKMRHAVTEEISQTILPELVASGDVTVVTSWSPVVNRVPAILGSLLARHPGTLSGCGFHKARSGVSFL